jgi:hypothetical protein
VIGLGIVSREAESETAFAGESAVASAGVAAAFCEDGEDVAVKAWGFVAGRVFDGDRDGRSGGGAFETYFCGAIGNGTEVAGLVDGCDGCVLHDELGFGDLPCGRVGGRIGFEGEQLLAGFCAVKDDGFRKNACGWRRG